MKTTPIAKITCPKVSGAVKRDRLFHLLDQGKQKPVIWIMAQGGSGKTTLVADWLDSRKLPCLWYQVDEGDADIASFFYYMGMAAKNTAPRYKKSLPILTTEYLQGIPVFTRRYFEKLFSRLKSPSVVVLDNYQDAPLASGFHDMIAYGLDTIPEGITVVVLSRAAPPPQLARLHANNRLHTIGWGDVRFTREESSGLLETHGHGKPSPEMLDMLHDKTEGWAAGLILLTAGADTAASRSFADMTADKLFDYFASEIFSKTDASIRDFLLKTSFLQKIDPVMAEQLTGNAMAGQVLERMSRNHYFTQKYGQAYQYHPLFREFLQSYAKTNFSSADMVAVQRKAAELLEQTGSEEEAVSLCIDSKDWSKAERMILKQAPVLASQGRSNTLEAWLNSLPRERIEKSPWALYWLSICRMAYNPAEARGYLEEAFPHFKNKADVPGLFLSWACIADTFLYEWGDLKPIDHWIAEADRLIAEYPQFPSPEIEARFAAGMLNALTWRQPYRSDLPVWAERVGLIAHHHPSAQLRIMLGSFLMLYYLWIGEFAKAGLLIDALRPVSGLKENDPLTQQNWQVMEAMYSWFTADHAACMQAVTNGLRSAEESGIHLLDLYLLAQGIYSGLSLEDMVVASDCLARMSKITNPRIVDRALYNYQAASISWRHGNFKKAIEQGRLALQLTEDAGGAPIPHAWSLIELALSLFDDGQHEEAKRLLARGEEIARGMNPVVYMHALYEAKFAFDLGDEEQGVASLRQGLAVGSQQGYVNMPRWNNRTMSRLCAKALEHNIEPDYVQKLIRTRGLVPEGAVTNWPYPIRIHTLGRFEILKDDRPVTFTGKVQKKPIELLKALIAMGGQDVPEGQLIDALWPDSEGDAGHGTLKTTILRLRQLLGCDKAVLVSGGAVTLDSRVCYVDAFAFEALMQEAELKNPQYPIALKVAVLYRGRFLPADTALAWTTSLRERLQNKFLRFNLKSGMVLEEQGRWKEAIELYHRAIEIDDLCEEFYQRLISSHLQIGQKAEAAYTYKRCKQVLLKALGIGPSSLTDALYQTALEIKN